MSDFYNFTSPSVFCIKKSVHLISLKKYINFLQKNNLNSYMEDKHEKRLPNG